MRAILITLPFVALTFLCWGSYGPVIHHGQDAMGHSSLRPFICVGLAYFVVAVIVPTLLLRLRGEIGSWTFTGTTWSLAAGASGAVGALGIIVAFNFGGNPVYVMPLVFGCAPVVNTFVTMAMLRSFRQAGPIFYLGVLLVALGAAGVLFFKPGGREVDISALSVGDFSVILSAIALTALTWGAYGPVLHKGQLKMGGSRMRPYMCVGLAYFAIAVVVPVVLLSVWNEPGQWTTTGSLWALGGGALGALGALGIVLAFDFGGKPIFVMPLVFGGAPVVNTFITTVSRGLLSQIEIRFLVSLLLVIVGAVTVLVFTPKPAKKPAASPDASPEGDAAPEVPAKSAP